MNNKKFKILLIVDIVLIIGLFALMMILKGSYNDQAQKSVSEQEKSYKEIVDNFKIDQWKSIDQYNMAWKLTFATLSGNKTEAAFNESVKKIQEDMDARIAQTSHIYDAATGKKCVKIGIMRLAAGVEPPPVAQQKAEIASECYQMPDETLKDAVKQKGLADKFLLKDEGGVKEIACGKNCVISFTFAKGKLKTADYKALSDYNMAENFKLEAPAPFHFE